MRAIKAEKRQTKREKAKSRMTSLSDQLKRPVHKTRPKRIHVSRKK